MGNEITKVLSESNTLTSQKCLVLYKKYDTNDDGELDKHEVKRFLHDLAGLVTNSKKQQKQLEREIRSTGYISVNGTLSQESFQILLAKYLPSELNASPSKNTPVFSLSDSMSLAELAPLPQVTIGIIASKPRDLLDDFWKETIVGSDNQINDKGVFPRASKLVSIWMPTHQKNSTTSRRAVRVSLVYIAETLPSTIADSILSDCDGYMILFSDGGSFSSVALTYARITNFGPALNILPTVVVYVLGDLSHQTKTPRSIDTFDINSTNESSSSSSSKPSSSSSPKSSLLSNGRKISRRGGSRRRRPIVFLNNTINGGSELLETQLRIADQSVVDQANQFSKHADVQVFHHTSPRVSKSSPRDNSIGSTLEQVVSMVYKYREKVAWQKERSSNQTTHNSFSSLSDVFSGLNKSSPANFTSTSGGDISIGGSGI